MAQVYLSIGSNVQRRHNIKTCLQRLNETYAPLTLSKIYENPAVGFEGDPFFNLVVGFNQAVDLESLFRHLREIEEDCGRDRTQAKFSPRTLDIDILLYDDLITDTPVQLPRDEITRYAFVLKPLAEINPEGIHPQLGETYADLWQRFAATDKAASEPLTEVSLDA